MVQIFDRHQPLPPQKPASLLLGFGMVLAGIGLLFRSRIAWTMSLLLGLVAAVNDASHMGRIKLVQPDMRIAPQVLSGELMALMLSGETVTPDFGMNRVFHSQEGKLR